MTKLKVLIINPPVRLGDKPRNIPHGLAIIANVIRKKMGIKPIVGLLERFQKDHIYQSIMHKERMSQFPILSFFLKLFFVLVIIACFCLFWTQSHAGEYYENWDKDFGGWETHLQAEHLVKNGNGFVRFSEPSRFNDKNHPKMGVVHLICWRYIGLLFKEKSLMLNGGDADFRGAEISLSIRGNDFKPNGAELVWWHESQSNIEVLSKGWRRANWAYTSHPLTEYLLDGKWHNIEFTLVNDESKWTYAGNNWKQLWKARRYSYWPLNEVLAHSNCDIIFILIYVNPENPPTGSIDFDELKINYAD